MCNGEFIGMQVLTVQKRWMPPRIGSSGVADTEEERGSISKPRQEEWAQWLLMALDGIYCLMRCVKRH
ncbi:uncharacterized [Tachysurus ichikawai]